MDHPRIVVTDELLRAAEPLAREARIRRTKASPVDALTGVLGEMVFAQYLFGDWRRHQIRTNRGKADFDTIEIKASAYPFHGGLHLLVREDYASKRKPLCYVQIIFDVASREANDIPANTPAVLCGFATWQEVDRAPRKDFGSKLGDKGGYRCRYIPVRQLHPMNELRLV